MTTSIILFKYKANKYIDIDKNCVDVFTFAKKVTFVKFVLLFLAFKSRKPPTQISLEIIKDAILMWLFGGVAIITPSGCQSIAFSMLSNTLTLILFAKEFDVDLSKSKTATSDMVEALIACLWPIDPQPITNNFIIFLTFELLFN